MNLNVIRSFSSVALLMATLSVNAGVIDFSTMADTTPGEGGHSQLYIKADGSYTSNMMEAFVMIQGSDAGGSAYAYLDGTWSGAPGAPNTKGGLGVCSSLLGGEGSECGPASDDNVSFGETLSFHFLVDVVVDSIWLNNNHDGDASLATDVVNINGALTAPTAPASEGDFRFDLGIMTASFSNGGSLNVGYAFGGTAVTSTSCNNDGSLENESNCHFYISKLSYTIAPSSVSVPEPTSLAIIAMGLFGVWAGSRRAGRSLAV
jgi:hypothetical protein